MTDGEKVQALRDIVDNRYIDRFDESDNLDDLDYEENEDEECY